MEAEFKSLETEAGRECMKSGRLFWWIWLYVRFKLTGCTGDVQRSVPPGWNKKQASIPPTKRGTASWDALHPENANPKHRPSSPLRAKLGDQDEYHPSIRVCNL